MVDDVLWIYKVHLANSLIILQISDQAYAAHGGWKIAPVGV